MTGKVRVRAQLGISDCAGYPKTSPETALHLPDLRKSNKKQKNVQKGFLFAPKCVIL